MLCFDQSNKKLNSVEHIKRDYQKLNLLSQMNFLMIYQKSIRFQVIKFQKNKWKNSDTYVSLRNQIF